MYQAEHPEFTLYFKYKTFVVPAPNSNDVMRPTDFAKVHTVAYSSKVDLLPVACDYLVERFGCTSWPQLLSVHENVLYTVISFARSLLAITRDYPEGPIANYNNSGAAENERD